MNKPRNTVSWPRIERNVDSIEAEVKEMQHAMRVYMSNPQKYEPQLVNLASAALRARRSAEMILRTLGVE